VQVVLNDVGLIERLGRALYDFGLGIHGELSVAGRLMVSGWHCGGSRLAVLREVIIRERTVVHLRDSMVSM
jgi:hypothetical protein